MKYRVIGAGMMILMLIFALSAARLEKDSDINRYHQHLMASQPQEECGCDGAELCTHLPIIRIETGGQYIPGERIRDEKDHVIGFTTTESGETEILVSIETVEAEGEWHHASDSADQSAKAYFRIRGNSSRDFDKKNYRIKLVEDDGTKNLSLPLLGMNEENDWALHGPFLDKTLIRNYMWMNISAEIMGYAPEVRFCEVILDGEYQGVYVLMETIKEGEDRVNLSDYEEGSDVTSYLLRLDVANFDGTSDDGDVVIQDYTWYTYQMEISENAKSGFQILYPKTEVLQDGVIDYIQRDISEIERGLYSSDMLSGKYDYEADIDVDSFVDYYILQEFLAVNDSFSRSTYMYRDVRGKLTMGPVWDYNNVLNNFFNEFSHSGFLLANRSWFGRLMTDEDFVDRVVARYRQLREGILSDEYLLNYIDETIDYLGPAVERNDEVWGYSYDPENLSNNARRHPDEGGTLEDVNPGSYEEAVGWMKGYMLARSEWLDENIENLYQYCHRSKTTAQRVE